MVKWIDSLNDALLRATDWAGKNLTALVLGFTFVLVIGAVWAGISYNRDSRSTKALTAYAPIERDFNTWKTPEPPAADPQKKEVKPAPVEKIDPATLFARMKEYIEANGNVPANELMVLMASEVAAVLGPAQEAELLSLAQKKFKGGSDLMNGLVLIKNGDLLVNQDQCAKALEQWKTVISNKKFSFLHDMAKLKSALCLEKMAQYQEAEGYYDQIIKGPVEKPGAQKTAEATRQNQWAVKEAQKLKRALKWSQKQPST